MGRVARFLGRLPEGLFHLDPTGFTHVWNGLPSQPRTASLDAQWGRTLDGYRKVALRIKQLQHMMKGGRVFGVMSAYGPGTKSQNQERHGEMYGDLQRMGYRRIEPLKGKWGGVAEKSVLVPGMKFSDLVSLGRKFDQESVIYKSAEGVLGMYYLREHKAEIAAKPTGEMATELAVEPQRYRSQDKEQREERDQPDLFSKSRGISFEFGFLWGDKLPWDGRKPITVEQVYKLLKQ